MKITVRVRDNQEIVLNYEVYGQGKRLLLLHGWGANLHSFDGILSQLSTGLQVFALDLPGFGLSQVPDRTLGTSDYAQIVDKFLETLGIDKISVLGHSFGGAVTIHLAVFSDKVKKIVLEDSSGIRGRTLWIRLRIHFYKLLKKITPLSYRNQLSRIFGSRDYQQSDRLRLRETFLKVVNEDLRTQLPIISAPTLIIWGERDQETPCREAEIFKSSIRNARMIVMKNSGHFPHLDNPAAFADLVAKFLKET